MEGNAIVSNDVLKGIANAIRGEAVPHIGEMTVAQMTENIRKIAGGYLEFYSGSQIKTDCTTIEGGAFYGCYNLSLFSLPSCTRVGDGAFANCASLDSFSLPACTSVGSYAFESCPALHGVTLPSCTSVGDGAFAYCTSLTFVSLDSYEVEGQTDEEREGNAKALCENWGLTNSGCEVHFKNCDVTIE